MTATATTDQVCDRVWRKAPERLELSPGEVHVWRASLSFEKISAEAFWQFLSDEERLRASQLHFPEDSDHYVFAHGVLKEILVRYHRLVKPPLRFAAGPKGQPHLLLPQGSPRLMFSLSHSHSVAFFAFVLNQRIGIDVEHEKQQLDYSAIAEQYFSVLERDALYSKPEHARSRAFLSLWTFREAYAKALGEGLSKSPTSYSVLQSQNGTVRVQESPDLHAASTWSLFALNLSEPLLGAVAVEDPISRVLCWDWNLH